ncbi:MAG: c-type cytochrome [Chloroflexota bacterium]|jgi:mono/diheme cytochrome c family protein
MKVTRRFLLKQSFIWLMLLAACGANQEQDLGDPATLGERTYIQWCVPCHGASGEGFVNTLNAPALNADGETYLLSDEAMVAAIIDGGAETGGMMNPLGDFLAPEQIAAVLEYIHTIWTDEQRSLHEASGGHTIEGPGN